jgi:hypothetical protein
MLPPWGCRVIQIWILALCSKVDFSGERLTCVGKSSGFWNTFSYNIMTKTWKITWGTPCRCLTIWGASWNFASLYHYIIRKCVSKSWTFSNASQSFFRAFYFSMKPGLTSCRSVAPDMLLTWGTNGASLRATLRLLLCIVQCMGSIAAPRLRPLFKDKQIVEGSDGCGLFVDN